MRLRRISTILSLMLIAVLGGILPEASARAINYSFNHIDSNEGLSSSCVKTIYQDSYGFMWFGTKNGLNRYDGRALVRYNCYDYDKQRGNNNIGALYETPDGRMWVGTDRGVYIYDRDLDKFDYLDAKSPDGVSPDDWVQDIVGDNQGNVWVLIPNQGVFRFNDGSGSSVSYYSDGGMNYYRVTEKGNNKSFIPVGIYATREGGIYAATIQLGLYKYDRNADSFVRVGNNGKGYPELNGKTLQIVRQGNDGNLILCTQYGELFHYNLNSGDVTVLPFSGTGKVFARAMMCVDDEIWLGTQTGLYIINMVSGNEVLLTEVSDNPCSLSNNTIYYLYSDHDGNAWVGTMFGGVNYFQRQGFRFDRFTHTGSPASLTSNRIRGMAKDKDGMIYVGTEESGFSIFDPVTGRFTRHDNGLIVLTARSFGDNVYVGYTRNGADVLSGGKIVGNKYNHLIDDSNSVNSVYSFLIDNNGNHWIGSDWGLFRTKADSGDLVQIEEIGQSWIFDLFQDSRGTIWIASMGNGVWKYNPSTGRYKHYPYDELYSNGLRSNSVSSIMEDSKGQIWISTDRGGLSRYDVGTDKFETFSTEEGLPDNVVYDVLEDRNGYLWFGTNSGLVKFDPETHVSMVFTTRDGLLGNQFNYHSAVAGDDGYFYFGSMNGLIAFNPDIEQASDTIAPVYFTSLRLADHEVVPGDENSPLDRSIMFTDCVELPHDFPGMTVGVSSPTFSRRGSVRYFYRLSPGDSTWLPLKDNQLAFANLSPGDYTLEVMATNGRVNYVKKLKINILAPWYGTWTALCVYLLLLIAAIVGWWFWYRRYKERQLKEKEQLYKVNKEKELYENKVSFFTELAHEIRTPLSLIDAPLQAIEDLEVDDARVMRYVKVMKQNTERLLNLTGQLLDFQKIGADKFDLKFEKVDITSVVNETLERFEPAMALKGKKVTKSIPTRTIYAIVDREAVIKILSNMFNNALKYSDTSIDMSLSADDANFVVRVTSDGGKISAENSLRIFEPFFQVDNKADNNGVGIGLPLCRTLAHLQHGSIEVEDTAEETNTFALTLPLRQDDVEIVAPDAVKSDMDEYIMKEDEVKPRVDAAEQSYSILLVEDNEQMRDFLYDQLSRNFVVETAENGVDALDKIKEHNFDLIVTDVMMPKMDGYELCTAIKEDINRSHLPVVFLTAKNDLDSKLKALKCGGEAYIEKPFSIKYFHQQILSLLENRRHERKAFLKQPFFSIDNMKLTSADKEFMDKVIANISANISDENFSVESMADVFCMSRSSLLRKIKTLFNQSPIELIRTIKLKKAAELIQEGKFRIGDVCYMVGINSASYFSKLFFKQFGLSPKDFEKQCKAKSQNLVSSENSDNQLITPPNKPTAQ